MDVQNKNFRNMATAENDIALYFSDSPFRKHHLDAMLLFQRGLAAHGVSANVVPASEYRPTDIAGMWGLHIPKILEEQKSKDAYCVILEKGYIRDREAFISIGVNGLNGYAEFGNDHCPSDRWKKHGVDVAPWRRDGKYIVIMGQCPGDASVRHTDILQWASSVALSLRERAELPVKFRPHPLSLQRTVEGADLLTGELHDALAEAALVVTFNSNSAVDAVLSGVPTVTCDKGSMAWDVSSHAVEQTPVTPDTTQWCYDLAYCQWTHDEIADGEAWEHIRHVVNM